jgi:hypothetical protein
MQDCGLFRVGRGTLRLWALIPETARRAGFFLVQAAPGNADIISLNGRLLLPGERHMLATEVMQRAFVCGPDPKSEVQVWAVTG